ncbi:MAG TPA: enoyl-CoA hydratase-related protein [Vicinamibacterales bacterium]
MADMLSVSTIDGGAFWRVTIGGSKGNVLDGALMDALSQTFEQARRAPALKALVLEGAGQNFSYGASVAEHLPDQVERMFLRFGALLHALLDSDVAVLAAVRGQCLGGGLELVTLAHRIFASADAKFGQPEIALGVFPPAASVLLPERIGRAHAEDLCLTGRVIAAGEAQAMGLVDEIADDPAQAALAWARAHFAAKSASSLKRGVRAVRLGLRARLRLELPRVERLYLDDLMQTADASEGLHAFLEKRQPVWSHR